MWKSAPKLAHARNAFTLVELLVVMAVLVVLAAVTLPSVKELLKGQKSSQAARLIQAYAETARARAVATGRPVAVVVERMYVDGSRDLIGNDSSTRLSIGEVFPPYEGDWAGSEASIISAPGSGALRGTSHALIDFSQAASLWDASAGAPSGLVGPGDIIMFGDTRRFYRINDNDANGLAVELLTGSGPPQIKIEFDNPAYDEDAAHVLGEPTIFPAFPQRFRIFRKPSKSLAGSITLPRGICVDLSCSGVGQFGVHFSTEAIALSTRSGDPGATHAAGAYGPIYIVFDPSGKVQDLYYGLTPNVPSTFTTHRSVGNTIHLLVGKTGQVFPGATTYLSPAAIAAPGDTALDDTQYNVLDPGNFWVSINPFSGSITTAQVQDQTAFPVLDSSLTAVERFQQRLSRSRSLATNGIQRTAP